MSTTALPDGKPARKSLSRRFGRAARRPIDPATLFPPPTKDLRAYQPYAGLVTRMVWRFLSYRLTRAGHWFAMLTFFLGLFGAISLEIQTHIPFLYSLCLWGVTIVAVLFSRPRVQLAVRHAAAVTAGETLTVDVTITRPPGRAVGITPDMNLLPHALPVAVDAIPANGVAVPPLAQDEMARVRFGLLCKQRGIHKLPGYRIQTDFPFGLMNAYHIEWEPRQVIVYPSFTPLKSFTLPVGERHQPGGVALMSHRGDSFEFLGNREFREGDNIRDIDWRATARMGGDPIVREWREEYFLQVGVILDTYLPKNLLFNEKDERKEAFERAVSVTAGIADYLARQDYVVDLFAAGSQLYHLTAGRSAAYLEQILDILAVVEMTPNEPLKTLESEILAHLNRLTTVICVFMEYDETRRQFVEMLRINGVGVRVIVVPSEAEDDLASLRLPDTTILNRAAIDAGVEEI